MLHDDDEIQLREGLVLRICHGQACGVRSRQIEAAVRKYLEDNALQQEIVIAKQSCFGRCFCGPTLLVERWRDGKFNERAMFSLMMGVAHPDLRYEHDVRPEDVPKLIRWHLRAWRRDRDAE